MNVNDIFELVKKIVDNANNLKNKYTDEYNAKVNYACIFCQNDDEYKEYISALKEAGNEVIEDTYSGPLFRIKDLNTVAGTLKLLKIRKYDDQHLDLGDADFTVSNFSNFKNKYLLKDKFKLISRENFEMIELMEPGNIVRTYFSNPPLNEQLNIK